ncbi:MAG TPA: AraC family transcriptional regulator [Usitatibacter sp.]|nr:AraC family transcriptional regulator [Usitatibacter sp.]
MKTQDVRLESALADLAGLLTRFTARAGDGSHATPIPGVTIHRFSAPSPLRVHAVQNPCVAVIAQGVKRVMLGDEVYTYDRANFLTGSVDLPVSSQVVEASAAAPYLSLKLDVDPREIAALLLEAPETVTADAATPARGIFMSRSDAALIESFVRLLRLLEAPEDIAVLAPLARREILYRLLKGEQGFRLRQIANVTGHAKRIAKAIEWLRTNFRQALRIEDLAAQANMSTSSFHEHFRAVTAMSPLQFQKRLRLQEARALLLAEALDAATAGHRVGYESPSQFSREYSRLFGVPPATDVKRMRGAAAGVGA